MSKRDEYIEKFKAQLDEWNTEIDKLQARADKASADLKADYARQIESLERQRDEARKRFRELESASEHAWEDFRDRAEKAWKDFEDGVRKAWSHFR